MSFLFQNYNGTSGTKIKEFSEVYKNKEERESWYKSSLEAIKRLKEDLTFQQRVFLAAYRGFYLEKNNSGTRTSHLPYGVSSAYNRRFKKFIVNHIHDITETKINKRAKLKPAVEVMPVHDEYSDKGAAKVTKVLVDNIFENNNLDELMINLDRYSEIMGEAYMVVSFDENGGQLHPVFKKAKEAGLKKVVLDDGSEVSLEKPVNIGEVKLETEISWRILLQPKPSFEDTEYFYRVHVWPKNRTAKRFGLKPEDLEEAAGSYSVFNPESLKDELLENHVPIYEFFHKHTEDVKTGFHSFVTADGKELMNEELKSSDGELPILRLTALDFPEEQHGVSRYEFALPIQRMIDNVNTQIAKNIYLSNQTKWVIQEGSVPKKEQLGNDNTILEFTGPIAPSQAQTQPNSPEVYSYVANLENKLQIIMGGVSDQSRGMGEAKYTSSVAMQYINELEMDRGSTAVSKRARFITQLARKVITCAKDNYEPGDERMIRLVGRNNSHLLRQFDVSVLHKPYDVKFENSSGLPESKAAKMERAQILVSQYPQALSPERWMQILELGDPEKAVSLKSAAVTNADAVVEMLKAGEPAPMPEEYDDHLVHWETLAAMFQNISFTQESPNEVFLAAKEHMMLREKLMIEKSKTNPAFAAQLARFPMFPLFFYPEYAPPASQAQQEAIVQGQANRGEQVTGTIPADPISNPLGDETNE